MNLEYLTVERIIENNLFVLNLIKVKKADKAELLNRSRLVEIVEGCKDIEGDIYEKAAFLLVSLIHKHPFASGNRRTAFVTAKEFLLLNKGKFHITDNPDNSRIMVGIREGFYSIEEIKDWIKHGKIREFKR
ncbi:MAG TPA: type II toxin-antitoxin system death-on-curing family toxin [Candidatus Nanoarchaeia archaeon]|nr:type II toxin-antitoxin system death-on-curing family toxin [Candidatus Nanoarchaeia archaeon]